VKKVFGFFQSAAAYRWMNERDDQQLLRAYAGQRSDDAFAALVKRHASLVYGTACRKLGNPAEAEEVTQAVFVALAKKAPFLCHHANLSGWVHQTTLLECRQHLRAELRRRRREQTAMQLNDPPPGHDGALAAELDDALLELPEKDRQPLLLRFFENLSLREVGQALSIREDAAQKRVSKSLTLLERILRRRGKDIGGAALVAALGGASQAAPAHVVLIATEAALAGATSTFALTLAFAKFMALTKTQTAVLCILALSTPLLLQTQRLHAARLKQRDLESSLSNATDQASFRSEWASRLRTTAQTLQSQRSAFAAQTAARIPQAAAAAAPAPPLYRWSDSGDFVRLPKSLLDQIKLSTAVQRPGTDARDGLKKASLDRNVPLDVQGNLSEAVAEGLGLSVEDQKRVSETVSRVKSQFDWLARQNTIVTNVMPPNIGFSYKPGELYTLKINPFPEQGEELKKQLLAELETAVGPERAATLMRQAEYEFEQAFQDFGASEKWLAGAPAADGMVTFGSSWSKGSSVTTTPAEYIPAELKSHFSQLLQKKTQP
jgi:RNA polymerase sigma factor (sigma-70 family)